MFKITWALSSDRHLRYFILIPDVHTLYTTWHIFNNYEPNDGMRPIDLKVTDLDGDEVDMGKGLSNAATQGTYSRHS